MAKREELTFYLSRLSIFSTHIFLSYTLYALSLTHHHRPPSITTQQRAIRAIHAIKFSLKKHQKVAFVFVFGLWWIWASIHSLHKHKRELSSPFIHSCQICARSFLPIHFYTQNLLPFFEAHAHVWNQMGSLKRKEKKIWERSAVKQEENFVWRIHTMCLILFTITSVWGCWIESRMSSGI